MKITIDGTVYEFQADKLSAREAMTIFDQTKMVMTEWQQGLQLGNPYSMMALVFLLKKRAGENPDWATFDFDLGSIEVADAEADASDPSKPLEPADAG